MILNRTSQTKVIGAASILMLIVLVPAVVLAQVITAKPNPVSTSSRVQTATSSIRDTPLFLPAVLYDSGGFDAMSVAVADMNGDGKADAVVSNYCGTLSCFAGTVSVLLGYGDGTFQGAVTYDTGGVIAESLAIADLNADGVPDVVVTNDVQPTSGSPGGMAVLLGNGDGTLQPAHGYPLGGAGSVGVAVADLNGDGQPDAAVMNECAALGCNSYGAVDVLLGNGDGSFQPATTYSSGGMFSYWIAIADVNGDEKLDLLVTNYCQPTCQSIPGLPGAVGVLLGNGDGTFQPVVTYPSGAQYAMSVTSGDLNGDGKPDLVVADCGINGCGAGLGVVGVLLGKGDGSFQPAVTYSSGGCGPAFVGLADVLGRGKSRDIVVVNKCGGGVGVLLGNGDGTFQEPVTYDSGAPKASFGASTPAIVDVNGDGKPDLLVPNYASEVFLGSVGVLLNNAAKSTTSTSFISSLNPSIYGQKVTWTATVTSSGSLTPTGKVRFMWSGYTIGSATLNSSGVASLTKSNLNADPYPLKAVYVGDAANLGSTSAVLNQVVLQTTSSATLTSTPNPSTVGQAVTFKATITSPTVTAMGPVTFALGKTTLGTAQLSGGKATFTTSSLPAGSNVIKVTYNGNSNIARSSAAVTQVVQP